MLKAHKIRLNPTPVQAEYFARAAGCARFVFNWGLEHWKAAYEAGGKLSVVALKKHFNAIKREEFPFVLAVTKTVAEGAFMDLGTAFRHFFRGVKAGQVVGYPQFKSKKRSKPSFYLANDKIAFDDHGVRIPKLGWVKMAEPLRFDGKVMSARVSQRAGWWWISVSVEVVAVAPAEKAGVIGVDLGLKDLGVTSDGMIFENQKHLKQALARLQHLHRSLSRKHAGSQRYEKMQRRLQREYYRIECGRQDAIHKMTTSLCQDYAVIGLEDLNVAGMVRNHRLSQALSDAAFGEIMRQLTYKAIWHGVRLQYVDRFFPSSKLCNNCGWRKADLTLADREWQCGGCGTHHQRDVNAAQNIRDEALRLIAASGRGYVGRETLVDRKALA